VATHSKAWVSGRSFAGIEGSNPAWATGECLFIVLCVEYRGLRRASHSSRGFIPTVDCLKVIVKLRK
jgi:hypothetical protein